MHLLVTILLASGVTSLKCIQCGGHGMAPCDKMRGSMMAIECPASSLRSVSSCYVGVEDTGAVRRDCLTLSSQTAELEGNAMSSLLNAPSVQRDFDFEWASCFQSTCVPALAGWVHWKFSWDLMKLGYFVVSGPEQAGNA